MEMLTDIIQLMGRTKLTVTLHKKLKNLLDIRPLFATHPSKTANPA